MTLLTFAIGFIVGVVFAVGAAVLYALIWDNVAWALPGIPVRRVWRWLTGRNDAL